MKEITKEEHLKRGERAFKLCKDCDSCPVVTIAGDTVTIVDDFGGKVTMTLDQFREAKNINT